MSLYKRPVVMLLHSVFEYAGVVFFSSWQKIFSQSGNYFFPVRDKVLLFGGAIFPMLRFFIPY